MIKINLLPPEERGKGTEVEAVGGFQLDIKVIAPAAILLISLIVISIWFLSLNNKKKSLDKTITQVEADLAKVKEEEKIVQRLEENKTRLKTHLGVIEDLDRGRDYWVQILDAVSAALPDLTWISKLEDESAPSKPAILIEGTSFSDQKVSEFMINLAGTDLVENTDAITLRKVSSKDLRRGDRNIELVSFSMKVELIPLAKPKSSRSKPKSKT